MGLTQGAGIDFYRPGKPADNANIEVFNEHLRAECLNVPWSLLAAVAEHKTEAWKMECNTLRPHTISDKLMPRYFNK